jgi:hypothetical protein
MIAFCTSLRARAMSNDWAYHTWLLERTVDSMLAQDADAIVVIACHDIPETPLARNPRVHFVPVTIDLPARNGDDMCADKVIKHSVAARQARDAGCEYVIFNDADDLVSNRVVAFVKANRGANGWFSPSQLFYRYGGRVFRVSEIVPPKSGPFVVVRSDLLEFNTPPFSGEWVRLVQHDREFEYLRLLARHQLPVCTLAAAGHGHYPTLMSRLGKDLQPLPFSANLVINHPDSMSTSGGTHGFAMLSSVGSLRRSLRWLPTLRPTTSSVLSEYHVPTDREIPASYRGGSVFWR